MRLPHFDWWKKWSGVVSMSIVVWALVYFPGTQIMYTLAHGDGLTEVFDTYSEANAVREGEGYVDRGFWFNYGLGDVSYGDRFDNLGGKHDKNLCPTLPCIYLHYPPGPDLLVGVMTKVCGKGNVSCFRSLPIGVGTLALIFFAWALTVTIGIERCAFVLGSFYFVPMVMNAMHNLHYHSYVVSLLFVHAGLLLFLFVKGTKRLNALYGGLFAIGFVGGWLDLDHAFHVAFLSLAFWLMAPDWRKAFKPMVYATLLAGGGYTFAFFLHLVQVRLFLGSWAATLADFGGRAAMRVGGHLEAGVTPQPLGRLLLIYWTRLLMEPQFLGFSFLGACAFAWAPLFARGESIVSRRLPLAWWPRSTYKWSFLVGFVIPDLWLIVMRQHASVHGHFLPRNFVVTFVVGAILLALSFRRPSGHEEASAVRAVAEPS